MLKHRKIGDANVSRLYHLLTELAKKIVTRVNVQRSCRD